MNASSQVWLAEPGRQASAKLIYLISTRTNDLHLANLN